MPLWLRKFTFQTIQDFYKQKNEAEQAQVSKSKTVSPKVKIPTYSTKGLKK